MIKLANLFQYSKDFKRGDIIVKENERDMKNIYIIANGKFELQKSVQNFKENNEIESNSKLPSKV